MEDIRNTSRIFIEKHFGKRRLGKPRRIWDDNINMDFEEISYEDQTWIELVQDRV
jgi:hypothetical protein